MIQSVLYQFAVVKEAELNDQKQQHVYQFIITPGAPWQHIYEALDEFKAKIQDHEAEANAQAAKAKEQAANEPESEAVVEPEIVSA